MSPDVSREDSLIAANREGIFSVPGYVAIYLAGLALGRHLMKLKSTFSDYWSEVKKLATWTVVMWISLYYGMTTFFPSSSRQMANWNYINWMVRTVNQRGN